jgi:hypothetical protein
MYSRVELRALFTEYFDDKVSPTRIDELADDVAAGIGNRRDRQPDIPLVVYPDQVE